MAKDGGASAHTRVWEMYIRQVVDGAHVGYNVEGSAGCHLVG